ncbi:MAG: M28 family metallopeptidase [Promethearchaeota archaeon]
MLTDQEKELIDDFVKNSNLNIHLKSIDFPRNIGTKGADDGEKYIVSTLKSLGYTPVIHEFKTIKSGFKKKMFLPVIGVIWFGITLLNILLFYKSTIIFLLFSLIILMLPLGVLGFTFFLTRMIKRSFMKYKASRKKRLEEIEKKEKNEPSRVIKGNNIIVSIGSDNAEQEFIFTSHHDSISLKVSKNSLISLIIIGGISLLAFTAIYIIIIIEISLNVNGMKLFQPYLLITLFIAFTSLETLLLARLVKDKASHGIIDNGTGVAILLEMAAFLKENAPENTKISLCFFGGEEIGLVGSKNYYLDQEFQAKKVHVVSVDMIGEVPPLKYVSGIGLLNIIKMDEGFNTLLENLSKELNLEIKGSKFPYAGSDFASWLLDGHPTNWLINKSNVIHSAKDNMENVNMNLVKDALKLLLACMLKI